MSKPPTIRVTTTPEKLAHGHYESLQRQVIEKLREEGVPVTGDFMIRGVRSGTLIATWEPYCGATYEWIPPDDADDLI